MKSILDRENGSFSLSQAKIIAQDFRDSGYDILKSRKFDDYWTKNERAKTRRAMTAGNVAAAYQQTLEHNRLINGVERYMK